VLDASSSRAPGERRTAGRDIVSKPLQSSPPGAADPRASRVASARAIRRARVGAVAVAAWLAVASIGPALPVGAQSAPEGQAGPGFGTDVGTPPGLDPGASPVQPSGVVRTVEGTHTTEGDARDVSERAENVARPPTRIVVPGEEGLGLTRDNPIPLGATCSCTIDRTGTISQFDITVLQVVRDAYPMIQQLNRFNPPPRPLHTYVAVYVGQQYIAGPENVAFTVSESDFRAAANDRQLEETLPLVRTPVQWRLQYDVYPGNYVNGWLFYELPVNRPAVLAWRYSYFGERAIWFALQ
jgi:hypothetical protein